MNRFAEYLHTRLGKKRLFVYPAAAIAAVNVLAFAIPNQMHAAAPSTHVCTPKINWGGATVTQDCGPGATNGFNIKVQVSSGGVVQVSWKEFCSSQLRPLEGSHTFSQAGTFTILPSKSDVTVMQNSRGCELHVKLHGVQGNSTLVSVNLFKSTAKAA